MIRNSEGVHPPLLEQAHDLDEIFSLGNPNPQRVGCPTHDELVKLSRRERPVGDPGYDHLTRCSPCYVEFRALQQKTLVGSRTQFWRWVGAAAAVIAIAIAGWLAYTGWVRANAAADEPTARLTAQVQIDFRPYATSRGPEEPPQPPPPVLPRAVVQANVILPAGVEPNFYEFELRDSNGQPRASGSGTSRLQEYKTMFDATLDLRSLPPGSYQFAVRLQGQRWRIFRIEIR